MNGQPGFRAVIFDLDNTLYPPESGLFAAIDERIGLFIRERLGLTPEDAVALRRRFRERYHITLRGLMTEHGVDPGEYLRYVHAVPVDRLLEPDPRLGSLLGHLGCPAHIFTNGSREHALKVLRRLGIAGCFGEIFDIAAVGYLPKPETGAFLLVLRSLGLEPGQALYVDDLPRNLETARRLGMATILLAPRDQEGGAPHPQARNLGELEPLLGALLRGERGSSGKPGGPVRGSEKRPPAGRGSSGISAPRRGGGSRRRRNP